VATAATADAAHPASDTRTSFRSRDAPVQNFELGATARMTSAIASTHPYVASASAMVVATVLMAFSAIRTRQVARFEPYQMSTQVALYALKTSKEAAVSTSLAVVAFDVLGPGGIGDAWLVGGLRTSVTMGCASTAPSNCEGSSCSTVWLQPEIDGCDVLNASHIHVAVATLSPELAVLNVMGATRGLRERESGTEYRFQLHLPAFNGSAWRWVSIQGVFESKESQTLRFRRSGCVWQPLMTLYSGLSTIRMT
jgi:hypothetical protein